MNMPDFNINAVCITTLARPSAWKIDDCASLRPLIKSSTFLLALEAKNRLPRYLKTKLLVKFYFPSMD